MADPNTTLEYFFRERHPEIQLYALSMRVTDKMQSRQTPEGAEMLRQHFLYLQGLEEQGKLFGSGPLDAGKPTQEGLCIVAAGSQEEAQTIAENEPFHKAGWRTNTVRTWQLNEGLTVALGKKLTGRA